MIKIFGTNLILVLKRNSGKGDITLGSPHKERDLKGLSRFITMSEEVGVVSSALENGETILLSTKVKTFEDLKKYRLKNDQLVLTEFGFGKIKNFKIESNDNSFVVPKVLSIGIKANSKDKGEDKNISLERIKLISIVDDKKGTKHFLHPSHYKYVLLDDMPVKFRLMKDGSAILTADTIKKLKWAKIFSTKKEGLQLFNELIKSKIWNPLEK